MAATGLFAILDSIDSTNNYAMQQVHAGLAKHGMTWFAQEQTAGKGQRGKEWQMEKGKNIAMSVLVQPPAILSGQPFYLSAAVAMACFDFFSALAGAATTIKWPNDIYWRDRKAGGILIENVLQGKEWKWAIIGIGININQVDFPAGLKNPVSLKMIKEQDFDTVKLAKALHKKVLERTAHFSATSLSSLVREYNQHLYRNNDTIRLKKGNIVFETVLKGVHPSGMLHTRDVMDREFGFGEVEWLL